MIARPAATTIVPLIALASALFASATTVALRGADPAAALYQRAIGLEAALAGKGSASIASFLDPIDRGSPRARGVLADDIEAFSHAAAIQIEEIKVDPDGRHGQTKHLLVASRLSRTGGDAMQDRFAWARGSDGRWYIDLSGENR